MSNIYVTEPPPSGRVVLETSRGDIEVELFAKECPKACKNFIALALEGYYDNLVWHRYLADFIIQTGDPSGTGAGGESFYGEPFQDEFHSRLRFNRRGLLGMANGSDRDTNESQFFLTLAPTPELQNRHTMFGRVVSNKTIYNLVALTESVGEVDDDNRPRYPPKLKTIRVLENPFEGEIKLRITREERLAIQRNKRDAQKRKDEREKEATKGQKKKNTALLSFGEEEDVADDSTLKGPKSSHDLLKNDKRLKGAGPEDKGNEPRKRRAIARTDEEIERSDPPTANTEVSSLQKDCDGQAAAGPSRTSLREASVGEQGSHSSAISEARSKDAAKQTRKGRALLEQFRSAYRPSSSLTSTLQASARDDETARLLKTFQSRMRKGNGATLEAEHPNGSVRELASTEQEEITDDMREYGEGDDDDDTDWRSHRFDFGGKSVLQDKHAEDEYVTLDPRDSTSGAARDLGFGGREAADQARRERDRQNGRRGRDYVDERSSSAYRDYGEKQNRTSSGRRHTDKSRGRDDSLLDSRDRHHRGERQAQSYHDTNKHRRAPRDLERW